jgi:hypothetical protein
MNDIIVLYRVLLVSSKIFEPIDMWLPPIIEEHYSLAENLKTEARLVRQLALEIEMQNKSGGI